MVITNILVIMFRLNGDGREIECLVNRERDMSFNDDSTWWNADLDLLDGDEEVTDDEYTLIGNCDDKGNPTTEDMFIRVGGGRLNINEIKIIKCE